MIGISIANFGFQNCNGVFRNCFIIPLYKLLKICTLHTASLNLYRDCFSLCVTASLYDTTKNELLVINRIGLPL